MAESKITDQKMETSPVGGDSLIAGRSLRFYWQSVRWFVVFLVIIEILNIIYEVYVYGHWIIEAVIFLLFNFWLMRIRRLEFKTSIAASIFLGLGAGLLLALFEIIWYYQVVYLLNLIRQPVIIVAVGLVVSFTYFLLFKNILSNNNDNNKSKGGGTYDRKTNVNNRFR